ncbi:MAG: HlyC/CorC family transporter [Ruminococcaceae bacterium]|nr:HlyC/CorC family transporter [Oscillospiraceae bacterium]
MTYLPYLLIIFVCLLFSAFFSGSEIAFNTANRSRLKKSADAGSSTARMAYNTAENFTTSLSTILIGNNLANIAASTAATVIAIKMFVRYGNGNESLASLVSTLVLTFIVLIFGEIIPKVICKKYADKVAKIVVIPIKVLTVLLYPIVFIVTLIVKLLSKIWGKEKAENAPTVTEDELSTIIDTVEEEGVIDEDQSELLQSTLDFQDTTVEEVMTARINMVDIDIEDDLENIVQTIDESRYSRIPVYEDDIDNIIGILYLNHYYKELAEHDGDYSKIDIRSLLLRPKMIHKTMKLPAALAMMREEKIHLAIVIDEFGGTLGIVSMEDILEEIVGEIWDESDEIVSMIERTGENTYDVSGEMNIDDFFYEIEFEDSEFECEYSTVGGWAVESLDADPHVGDSFTYKNLCVIVTEMDEFRVVKLTVLVTPADDEDDE